MVKERSIINSQVEMISRAHFNIAFLSLARKQNDTYGYNKQTNRFTFTCIQSYIQRMNERNNMKDCSYYALLLYT